MAGTRPFRKLQLGREATAGTIVAATTLWRGMGTIEDQRTVVFPKEDIGIFSGVDRAYTPAFKAGLQMEDIPATFEQFPHLLEASVKTATPAADGSGGTGFKYVYAMPTTSPNTIKTYTIEGGDNQEAEVMEYSHVTDWKLSGAGGNALMMGATWAGRQVALQAFTGSVAVPSIEEIIFSKGKLYVDAIGGTIGTTQQTSTWLDVALTYKSGWVPVMTGDGNLYFSFIKCIEPEVSGVITFEHDSFGAARKVDWRAGTARLIRMQWSGSAYGTAGTGTLNTGLKTLRMDGVAKILKVSKIGERNGNDILTVTFNFRYNATAAIPALTITVTNENATIP